MNTPTRDHPQPTDIDGIEQTGDGAYGVRFTLYVDADSPDQAAHRAMKLRDVLVRGAVALERVEGEPNFYWHLHDHDGC